MAYNNRSSSISSLSDTTVTTSATTSTSATTTITSSDSGLGLSLSHNNSPDQPLHRNPSQRNPSQHVSKVKIDNFEEIYAKKCPGMIYIPTILPAVSRIVVFGDIHGDYSVLLKMLKISKVADDALKWTGKNTHVIQIGDQIDSYRKGRLTRDNPELVKNDTGDDIKIMELCNTLHAQAIKEGGMFISLLGNHELMNNQGDMRYVSHKNIEIFKGKNGIADGLASRTHSFAPGNEIATMMGCTRMACIIIGEHLFVHAGIINELIDELGITKATDLESINMAVQLWLLGLLKDKESDYINKILNAKNSMFWARILGEIDSGLSLSNPKCKDCISKVLTTLKIGNMVIGHTPQSMRNRNSNSTCDNRIWRIDNGSSYAFNSMGDIPTRRVQVLEITHDHHTKKDTFTVLDK